jgi:hypothetical protein
MWFAFDVGGAGGVIAGRVADSVPALLFGLPGSATADRFSRKRLMVGADLVLGAATSYFTELRAGIAALRPRPLLAAGVLALGVAVTITSGSWIAGIPKLVRDTLHHGAGGFSLLMVGYAAGFDRGRHRARPPPDPPQGAGVAARVDDVPPGYGLLALAGSLPLALAGGRVLGVVSLTHRGAHATGLLLVSPLFLGTAAPAVFGGAAIVVPLVGLLSLGAAARARATRRSRRS